MTGWLERALHDSSRRARALPAWKRELFEAAETNRFAAPDGPWGGRTPRPGVDINGGGQASDAGFRGYLGNSGRNRRSVWTIPTKPYPDAHFATFPPKLIEPCVLAGCPEGGTVLDPFAGSGTTGEVALKLGRRAVLIEQSPEYAELIRNRLDPIAAQGALDLGGAA